MEKKLQIRCSDEQKNAWTRAAGGERSLSEWMRATLDRQARITTISTVGATNEELGIVGFIPKGEKIDMGGTTPEPDPPREEGPPPGRPEDKEWVERHGMKPTPDEMIETVTDGRFDAVSAIEHTEMIQDQLRHEDDDSSPEPEELVAFAPPPVIPPQVLAPQYTLPSPTCRNAVYHWKLTAGEACAFCGGRA